MDKFTDFTNCQTRLNNKVRYKSKAVLMYIVILYFISLSLHFSILYSGILHFSEVNNSDPHCEVSV